jgi:hypothetical protein
VPTSFSRVFLIAVLGAALATNARAETLNAARDQIVTGIVVVSAGDPAGAKPGERMTLEGRRRDENGKMPIFEARRVIKDLGSCQP